MHMDKAVRTLQELRIIQERYVDKVTPLGEIRISIMAEEAADAIEYLIDEVNSRGIKCIAIPWK